MHVTTPLYTHIAVYFTPFLFFSCRLTLARTHAKLKADASGRAEKRHLVVNSGTFYTWGMFYLVSVRGGSTGRKGLFSGLVP